MLNPMHFATCAALWLAAAAGVPGGPAVAAEPTYPPGSPIGLVPPPGFQPSQEFTGFAAPDLGASIVLATFPAAVYDEIGADFTREELAEQGMTWIGPCGDLAIDRDYACYRVHQEAAGLDFRKWLLLVRFPREAVYVIANVPESVLEQGTLTEESMEAALSTVVYSDAASIEPRDALPFTIDEGNLLPFDQTLGAGGAVYAAPAKDDEAQPLLVVAGSVNDIVNDPDAVADFNTAMLKATDPITDVEILDGWPETVGGLRGFVHEGTATDRRTGAELFVLQAILVSSEGRYFRVFGMAPAGDRATYRPEFLRLLKTLRPR